MDRRFLLFLVLAFSLVIANVWINSVLHPPQPRAKEALKDAAKAKEAGKVEAATPPKPDPKPDAKPQIAAAKPESKAEPALPVAYTTLGSVDLASPYRMLVTLTNRGAAVVRVELASPNYHNLEDRGGYLGHVAGDLSVGGKGCPVDVVGAGTPAADAKLKPGDLITALDDAKVASPAQLAERLARHKPGQSVTLTVLRDGVTTTLGPVRLARRPLEVIAPEERDPLSFLTTLQQIDDAKLETDVKSAEASGELDGVRLRSVTWEQADAGPDFISYRRGLPGFGLEILKTYRVQPVPTEQHDEPDFPGYHLAVEVSLRNVGRQPRRVAYQLDGPTGLPTEGYWYASKVGYGWGAAGLRDVVVSFDGEVAMVECPTIADEKTEAPWMVAENQNVSFIGVDAQYFSAVMIPQKPEKTPSWIARAQPLRVGKKNAEWPRLTNTSCRLISREKELAPGGTIAHQYTVFVGPKRPPLLEQYKLGKLVYYGWFGWVAVPMLHILHGFYFVVRNYGVAIVLLTALVRLCMFPLSRKQALGAQKMAQLQPEMKKLQEKYKNNLEARHKAQQELFRKHDYHPLSGCLVVFIQLPIFVGLYRALMVDVELRQAPLLSEAIRWCSNLAAPDMLFDWRSFMPRFITDSAGMLGLGPYFNILPIFTIILFLWQQKKMMPPPADEQAAMQQKVMQWMMVVMGVLFFKVASGLCIYFIASSLWGMGERKFLPRFQHQTDQPAAPAPAPRPAPPKKGRGR